MNERREELWESHLAAGVVRYRGAEFKCRDVTCQRWHAVTGPRSYGHYENRNHTLEDMVLDALRTSATRGCQHPRKPAKKPAKQVGREEESTNGIRGPEAADGQQGDSRSDEDTEGPLYIEDERGDAR
jgi:hypothetical protein